MDKKLEELENKIETLYVERDKKISDVKSTPGLPKGLAERRIEYIKQEYWVEIEPLERNRRYIIEKTNLTPSQVHYGKGDNVGRNKNQTENRNFFNKFLWPVAVIVVAAIILYYFGIY